MKFNYDLSRIILLYKYELFHLNNIYDHHLHVIIIKYKAIYIKYNTRINYTSQAKYRHYLICFQSDFDKRQFAIKSHEFNLKDKVYCDIFPDLAVASQQVLDERKVILNLIYYTH